VPDSADPVNPGKIPDQKNAPRRSSALKSGDFTGILVGIEPRNRSACRGQPPV